MIISTSGARYAVLVAILLAPFTFGAAQEATDKAFSADYYLPL